MGHQNIEKNVKSQMVTFAEFLKNVAVAEENKDVADFLELEREAFGGQCLQSEWEVLGRTKCNWRDIVADPAGEPSCCLFVTPVMCPAVPLEQVVSVCLHLTWFMCRCCARPHTTHSAHPCHAVLFLSSHAVSI